jgi:hypothetical protein
MRGWMFSEPVFLYSGFALPGCGAFLLIFLAGADLIGDWFFILAVGVGAPRRRELYWMRARAPAGLVVKTPELQGRLAVLPMRLREK